MPGGPPLALAATSLPAVTSGANYSAAISASGGTSPYQWSISAGTLPAGLTLGPTGVISGTPTASGTSSFTVQVTDSSKPPQTATGNQSITVSPSAAQLAISTSSLPGGTKGAAYSATLQATGGVTPYSWAISSGSLPGGLQLSATSGAISGTPTATGTFSFTAKVTDSSSPPQSSFEPLSITISNLSAISVSCTPSGGESQGGSLVNLASCVQVNQGDFLLVAATTYPITPQASSVSSVTDSQGDLFQPVQGARCVDANGGSAELWYGFSSASASNGLTATVHSSLQTEIATAALPAVTVSGSYSETLQALGGTPPYTWTVTSGALPSGLALASNGIISGTGPSTPQTANFTVQVKDSSSPAQVASAPLSISAISGAPPVVITTGQLPLFTVNPATPYSATLSASGGVPPYTWTNISSLPPGLNLDTSGVISGTPEPQGYVQGSTFMVEVTDSSSPPQTSSATLSLNPPFTAGFLLQASGVDSAQPVDQAASLSNQPADTIIASPSITTSFPEDLVVAANGCAWLSNEVLTPGFQFVNLGGCSGAYQVVSATGTFQVTWDQDDGDPAVPVSGTYCSTIASFKAK
ncbi:MAG TPA: Ig domain-containing protein [Candidatus Acidoferrales bacterium]|nr:Ig domain-containing protein [Candidatus Acidoferrales bacterium]